MTPSRESTGPVRFSLATHGMGDVETFVATIRRLSIAQSVEEVMATATPALRRLLGADGITFVLRDGELCHYADEDAIAPLWKGKRFPLDTCISGWCMTNRQAAAIRDIYQDDRIPHDAYRPTFVRSLAMVPVRKDDPVAAIGAYWAKGKQVSREELDLLQTMADAAALAIANVRLRRSEEDAALIRQESFHRIKNIFSVAVALASQTDAHSVEAYREALVGRFQALESAHSAVFGSSENAVGIRDLLEKIVSAYAPEGCFQLRCNTGRVLFSASTATDLALVINELAMNAAEHGAWSTATGRIEILCDRADDRFLLRWQEMGGPPVSAPSRSGFGMRLMQGIADHNLGGELELDWGSGGLTCELRIPIGDEEAI